MMLLMGMWMSFTKKPMNPMMANPIAVAVAIFWNSGRRYDICNAVCTGRPMYSETWVGLT